MMVDNLERFLQLRGIIQNVSLFVIFHPKNPQMLVMQDC